MDAPDRPETFDALPSLIGLLSELTAYRITNSLLHLPYAAPAPNAARVELEGLRSHATRACRTSKDIAA